MKGDIPSFIGLMRRASCLAIGEDDTLEAVSKGKARLLLLPAPGASGESASFAVLA